MSAAVSALLTSFLASALFCALGRLVAIRINFVARPRADRWGFGERVIALGGGLPMMLAVLLAIALFAKSALLSIGPALLLTTLLGIIDDWRSVSPAGKLVIQFLAASYLVAWGFLLPIGPAPIAIPITVLWLVTLSNSVNFLDNMDGLSGSIGLVAGLSYFAILGPSDAALAASIAGGAAGFLIHNWRPARLFMGDAGSLPLGLALASLATRGAAHRAEAGLWLAPLLMLPLIVPLFDTALVAYTRRRARRPFLMGGRDHSSHRLVAQGLSEVRAVLALAALGALAGAAAWIGLETGAAALAVGLVILITAILGIFLSEVADKTLSAVSPQGEAPRSLPGRADFMTYVLEGLNDVALIVVVWTGAHWLRFQDVDAETFRNYMDLIVIPMLPIVLPLKVSLFFLSGLYRGVWRPLSLEDIGAFFRGASFATLMIVLVSALNDRLANLSRVVIVLDWLATFLGLMAIRGAVPLLRRLSGRWRAEPVRAAFLGPSALEPFVKSCCEQARYEYTGARESLEQIEDWLQSERATILILCSDEKLDATLRDRLIASGLTLRSLKIDLQ